MSAPILLDTCAVLWLALDAAISDAAVNALDEAFDLGTPVFISPISAWETGLLATRGRLNSSLTPRTAFQRVVVQGGARFCELTPDVLIDSSFLPGAPPRDPADRIIAATAREHGFIVMTRDQLLLDYAAAGHLQAIAC